MPLEDVRRRSRALVPSLSLRLAATTTTTCVCSVQRGWFVREVACAGSSVPLLGFCFCFPSVCFPFSSVSSVTQNPHIPAFARSHTLNPHLFHPPTLLEPSSACRSRPFRLHPVEAKGGGLSSGAHPSKRGVTVLANALAFGGRQGDQERTQMSLPTYIDTDCPTPSLLIPRPQQCPRCPRLQRQQRVGPIPVPVAGRRRRQRRRLTRRSVPVLVLVQVQ